VKRWPIALLAAAGPGICGPGILIDPARQLVVASNGNWPGANVDRYWQGRAAFYRAVQSALDADHPR
jgi:CubicO group peptidase (beta-lactamase class C family)